MPHSQEFFSALSRRDFVRWSGLTAAASFAPSGLRAVVPRRAPPFEVSASTYAWELHDEGVAGALDNMQTMAAVNSVYLIAIMHPERRPFRSGTFPHNPVRQTWQAEDARCYWHPDASLYGRIKPVLSEHAFLNETDWMAALAEECRRRDIKLGVELSHALVDRERMEGEFSDVAQRNIHGEISHVRQQFRPACPNHPATPEYAVALVTDLVKNYDVDYIQSCIITYSDGGPGRSGCFCDHCMRTAGEMGFDLPRIQADLLADLNAQPALAEWEDFRFQSTARFYRTLHAAAHAIKATVDLRYNMHMTGRNPLDWGMNLPLLKPHLDSLRIMDYTEQEGNPELMSGKKRWLTDTRRLLGSDFKILSALGVRLNATPELIREGVKIAVDTGMDGVTLGHYDGATFPILRAVRDGLRAAGVELPQTT